MESEKTFMLSQPITAAGSDGLLVDVLAIQLVAPSKKLVRKTLQLQSYLTRAFMESTALMKSLAGEQDIEEAEQKAEKEELDANTLRMMLMASTVDVDACITEFEKLALKGAVTVDDRPLNPAQLNKMDPEDLMDAAFEYMAAFTIASVMKGF